MFELVLIGLLGYGGRTRCCHGKWAPLLALGKTDLRDEPRDIFCIYCDTGQST